jgi:hypothetical protein
MKTFEDQIGREDVALVESVQRGFAADLSSADGCCRRASG